jgi:hypothetical protein
MSVINIIIGILLWIGIYTIIARICDCFERCSMSRAYKSAKEWKETNKQKDKKVTVEDLYPKENQND